MMTAPLTKPPTPAAADAAAERVRGSRRKTITGKQQRRQRSSPSPSAVSSSIASGSGPSSAKYHQQSYTSPSTSVRQQQQQQHSVPHRPPSVAPSSYYYESDDNLEPPPSTTAGDMPYYGAGGAGMMMPHHHRHSRHNNNTCKESCWRRLRHCCCRYGLYPLLVAPILTAGALLSVYSSAGCDFVQLDVGFEPNNMAYNQSMLNFGLWYQYNATAPVDDNPFVELLHGGCVWYNDVFDETFIKQDRTWMVARVMSLIAGSAGLLSALLAWTMTLTSLVSASWAWPCLLLPLTMVSFIGEGAKFIIFDVAMCSNAVWYPSGLQSLPQQAASCTLGPTSLVGVVAGGIQLVGLVLVLIKLPYERTLDPDYGLYKKSIDKSTGKNGGAGGDVEQGGSMSMAAAHQPFQHHAIIVNKDGSYLSELPESSVYDDLYTDDDDDLDNVAVFNSEQQQHHGGNSSNGGGDGGNASAESDRVGAGGPPKDDDPSNPVKPPNTPTNGNNSSTPVESGQEVIRISESRIEQMQKMQRNLLASTLMATSNKNNNGGGGVGGGIMHPDAAAATAVAHDQALIEQLVQDLNKSFQ